MDSLGKPGSRAGLTPIIGLGLAAIVAGSLVMLSVLAQRVSLESPLPEPVQPRRLSTAPVPGVSIPSDGVPARERERRRPLPITVAIAEEPSPARVLPLRLAAKPRRPARPVRPKWGPGHNKPDVGRPVALGHKKHHPPALGHHKRRGLGHHKQHGVGHARHHHGASSESDSRHDGPPAKPKFAATRPERPRVQTGPPPHARGKGKGKGHK